MCENVCDSDTIHILQKKTFSSTGQKKKMPDGERKPGDTCP